MTKAALRKHERLIANSVGAALFIEGAEIFAASQELVPVDTGRLRASGLVFITGRSSGGVSISAQDLSLWISYGTNYALAVHEGRASGGGKRKAFIGPRQKPKKRRKRKRLMGPVQTRPRYLAIPYEAALNGFQSRLAAEVAALVAIGGNPLLGVKQIKGKRKG